MEKQIKDEMVFWHYFDEYPRLTVELIKQLFPGFENTDEIELLYEEPSEPWEANHPEYWELNIRRQRPETDKEYQRRIRKTKNND